MPGDDGQSVRRGTRTISQSQQLPKLPSQSTDQNLSDVRNEEWETASESSDVLAHHHTHDTRSEDSKSSANLNFGFLSPVFVLSPVNSGAVLFQNMTIAKTRVHLRVTQ